MSKESKVFLFFIFDSDFNVPLSTEKIVHETPSESTAEDNRTGQGPEKNVTQKIVRDVSKSSEESDKKLPKNQNPTNSTKPISRAANGVTLRDSCCPCLLENLDSTTSILLQIYNQDRNRRNKTVTNSEISSMNTKSKRSVKSNAKRTKRKGRKSGAKRKHRRKGKRNKRQKGLLNQLDVCCLCNFLPEEDLSLLSVTKTVGNISQNDSSSKLTTERIEMTSKIFPDDITRIQETTPSSETTTTSDNSAEFDDFKDTSTTNILQGASSIQP